jgi:hypothetical protein
VVVIEILLKVTLITIKQINLSLLWIYILFHHTITAMTALFIYGNMRFQSTDLSECTLQQEMCALQNTPLWKGKNPIYFGVKGQGHCYYKYSF